MVGVARRAKQTTRHGVCGGGCGVCGGRQGEWVAWRGSHTVPTRPPPTTTMAPTTSPCVCVCGTRGVVVVTTTPKQPGKRHACACAVCVMAHESRWMSTRTPTSVCGGCVGSEATSV